MRRVFRSLAVLLLITLVAFGQSKKTDNLQQDKTRLEKDKQAKVVDERRLVTKDLSKAEMQTLLREIQHLNDEINSSSPGGSGTATSANLAFRESLVNATTFDAPSDVLAALERGMLIAADFKKTADEVKEPFDTTLETYDKLAETIIGEQKPDKPATPYSIDGFAAQVEQAAQTLAQLPLNPDVDPTQYSVSLAQLGSCVTQDSALTTLHAYADAMDRSVAEAAASLDYLTKLREGIAQLNSLAQAYTKAALIGVETPDWTWYFSSTFWDLDGHLAPSIAHLDNAARERLAKITTNMNRTKLQADNLRANLQLLKPNWCILGGPGPGSVSWINCIPLRRQLLSS